MRGLALLLLLAPTAAYAAEGMPQLDFSNPLTLSQVVWLGIIFLAFYLLLARTALPRVSSVLADRSARIEGDLSTARVAKAAADADAAAIAEATRSARAEAQGRIATAVAEAKATAAARAQSDDERLNRQLAEAEQRIGVARASAMGALRQVASETAGSVVQRLTGQAADPAMVDQTVGGILAARQPA